MLTLELTLCITGFCSVKIRLFISDSRTLFNYNLQVDVAAKEIETNLITYP